MSVVVKQTLYNTQLIKLKHHQDDDLWREINAFRTYKNRREEIAAGFIPANYQTMEPNIGLKHAIKSNNVFLVKEFIRLGARANFRYLQFALVNESYDVYVILCKNLIKNKKWRDHTLFEEFVNAACWYSATDDQLLKFARSISRRYLLKRVKQLSAFWRTKRIDRIVALAYPH